MLKKMFVAVVPAVMIIVTIQAGLVDSQVEITKEDFFRICSDKQLIKREFPGLNEKTREDLEDVTAVLKMALESSEEIRKRELALDHIEQLIGAQSFKFEDLKEEFEKLAQGLIACGHENVAQVMLQVAGEAIEIAKKLKR